MKYLPLVGTLLSATPALALDHCKPTPEDAQSRVCVYDQDQRYLINGVVGEPVNIRVGSGERIKRPEFAFMGKDSDGRPAQTWRGPKSDLKDQPVKEDLYKNNL